MNYLVRLNTRIGEYEEYPMHIIEADDRDDAVARAFEDESRGDLEFVDGATDEACDCRGEIHIVLQSCEKVTNAEYKVLRKFL